MVSSGVTISRPFFHPLRSHPPPGRRQAPERTCATPQSDTLVPDRSHAHGSRTWTVPDYPSHQPVTGRRYTGLTVTFSRPAAEQAHPPTEPRGSHTRSLFREAMGHRSLGHAHLPHGVGAGADCALSRPSWTAILAHRLRQVPYSPTLSHRPRAPFTRVIRCPLLVASVIQDHATGQGIDDDD